MVQICGETLATVRQARGMTQVELADSAGISQGYLSKMEAETVEPDDDRLERVAMALQIRPLLLAMPMAEASSGCAHFRKRASMRVTDSNRVLGELALRTHLVDKIIERAPLGVELPQESLEGGFTSAEEVAQQVRALLAPCEGPLENLVDAVERAGCVVSLVSEPDIAFDAVSIRGTSGGVLMLVNSERPSDRMRFTIAHELGHATMHEAQSPTSEAEADQFAAELLMPAATIRPELEGLDFERLAPLKKRWRVSMSALIRRAFDLDVISERRYRQLNIELSKAGYRKSEPLTPEPERPARLQSILASIASTDHGLDDLVADLGLVSSSQLDQLISSEAPAT